MRILLTTAIALALWTGSALAAKDVMATRYGNTTDTVDALGVHTKIYYHADHTFKANSAGVMVSGTWKLKGPNVCLTYFKPPAETCTPTDNHKVGDTWTTGTGVLKRTVTLKKGVQ